MILSDDEIKAIYTADDETHTIHHFARLIESAVIAKLTAGVELPKSNYIVMSTGESAITVTQALQYGASQRLAGQQWRTIETAPKSEAVLVAAEFDGPGDWRIKCGWADERGWRVWGASWTPTHWMPLPPAPGTTEPAAQHDPFYSIDADPQGIRARVISAVQGALILGARNENKPPKGHWLNEIWDTARAEREQIPQPAPQAQQEPICKECGDTGSIYAVSGEGPFDCYACNRKAAPAAQPRGKYVVTGPAHVECKCDKCASANAVVQTLVEALNQIDQEIDLGKYPSAPDVTLLDVTKSALAAGQQFVKESGE